MFFVGPQKPSRFGLNAQAQKRGVSASAATGKSDDKPPEKVQKLAKEEPDSSNGQGPIFKEDTSSDESDQLQTPPCAQKSPDTIESSTDEDLEKGYAAGGKNGFTGA